MLTPRAWKEHQVHEEHHRLAVWDPSLICRDPFGDVVGPNPFHASFQTRLSRMVHDLSFGPSWPCKKHQETTEFARFPWTWPYAMSKSSPSHWFSWIPTLVLHPCGRAPWRGQHFQELSVILLPGAEFCPRNVEQHLPPFWQKRSSLGESLFLSMDRQLMSHFTRNLWSKVFGFEANGPGPSRQSWSFVGRPKSAEATAFCHERRRYQSVSVRPEAQRSRRRWSFRPRILVQLRNITIFVIEGVTIDWKVAAVDVGPAKHISLERGRTNNQRNIFWICHLLPNGSLQASCPDHPNWSSLWWIVLSALLKISCKCEAGSL